MPYSRNPFFTGREDILESLHATLNTKGRTALSQTQAISGLGGIGKTQTAVEYAFRYRDEYKAVLWVSADSETTLFAGFTEIASLLDIPLKKETDQKLVVANVKRWFEINEEWLLVWDNIDAQFDITSFLPNEPKGHIILTTRLKDLDFLGIPETIELDRMSPDEALEFLVKRTDRKENDPEERKAAAELAQELDYLPLALEQAGAFIKQSSRFQDYLKSYRQRFLALLEKRKPFTKDYDKSVATTWSASLREIERISKASADLLRLSVFFAPESVPDELIIQGHHEMSFALSSALKGVKEDPLLLDEVLEPLSRYALIQRDFRSKAYRIHRLVHRVVLDGIDETDRQENAKQAIRVIAKALPDVEFQRWELYERLLVHVFHLFRLTEHLPESPELGFIYDQIGHYLNKRGRFDEAEPLLLMALSIRDKALDPNHPDIGTSLNNLAFLYDDRGRYEKAEPLYERALAIREEAFGPDHPDVAASLNNLAFLYVNQGRYEEAEHLFERGLAIREEAFGPDHPDVAKSLSNLGSLYDKKGRYEEAEYLLERGLAIHEKAFGPDHPDVAASLSNLGYLYGKQGRYEEAKSLFERGLAIHEKALGPDHPDVAKSLNNLAFLYVNQGRYEEAEYLLERGLAIHEKAFGPDHPDMATSLGNLGYLYVKQGRYEEAESLFERGLAIHEKALGPDHPDVTVSLNNKARIFINRKFFWKAEPLLRRSLIICEKAFGRSNPKLVGLLLNYAFVLRNTKQEMKAKQLENRAKNIRSKFPNYDLETF